MQRAGYRGLDHEIESELFARDGSAHVPAYSADRRAADRVVRRMAELHPDWDHEVTEDHWGFTVRWACPWPPPHGSRVVVGEYRAPAFPVALCRAALVAHRNLLRYEERRRQRGDRPAEAPPELRPSRVHEA